MLPTLRHYWRSSLAVLLAAAVASSVLTGALLVGDSMRGSLRDLTLDRLGRIDDVILGQSFFRQELPDELQAEPTVAELYTLSKPAILVQGSASHAREGTRASRINLFGVGPDFPELFPETGAGLSFERRDGQFFPSVRINEALRAELGAAIGDQLVLAFERPSEVPRESLLGTTDPTEVVQRMRVVVAGVLPNRGLGRFGLIPHQSLPLNAFVELGELQRTLDLPGRINAALFSRRGKVEEGIETLEAAISKNLELSDVGLEVRRATGYLELSSREVLLRPPLAAAIAAAAAEAGAEVHRVSTYLANRLRTFESRPAARRDAIPYSTLVAMDTDPDPTFGRLTLVGGGAAPALGEGEILLNTWAAEELAVFPGDAVELTYFEVGPREELVERTAELTLRGVVEMEGLGADPSLTPDFPGVHDADDMSEWNPAFPVDLSRIAPADEAYWDAHRAAPKAFVAERVGRRLWGSRRFGDLTAIRLGTPPGVDVQALEVSLKEELFARLQLEALGVRALAVKEEGLRASAGATDFAGLFVGFSLFLIVSSALLVSLFFRLGVEARASEVGLRLALGLGLRRVRRRFLAEGALLAGLGTLLGLIGAVAYAGAMMAALRSWWIGAVGSTFLFLHVTPASLILGLAISWSVVLVTLWRAVRRLASLPAVGLLRGVTTERRAGRPGRGAKWVALTSVGLAALLLLVALWLGESQQVPIFFGVGAFLLIAGLGLFSLRLTRLPSRSFVGSSSFRLVRMVAANVALNPGRSLLSVALVASACFVIVAVGAHGLRFGQEVRRLDSGGGGYALVAEADVPLHHDLNRLDGREELGFSDRASELLAASQVVPFRLLPGDDVSCLNLYQPEKPRLIGVPPEQVERGGFQFQSLLTEIDEPWRLLLGEEDGDVIPAFGDANSVTWILKSGLGKEVVLEDDFGRPLRLRIVGLFRRSLFQSELLISEANFLEHFPNRSGYAYFLIDTPPAEEEETVQELEKTLAPYGFDITTTVQKLQSFQAVENTYLGTFQTLGGLGLLLGTIGLAVVLLRNILERRGELATLRALGFRRVTLGWLVVGESAFVLVSGVALGSLSALVAVLPHLLSTQAAVPWDDLTWTLLAILAIGIVASLAAVRQALRTPLLPALRAE